MGKCISHPTRAQVTNCTAGVQQAAIPAQSATLAGAATQGLTFDVYMQTDQGSNNSCVVTAYNSQVRTARVAMPAAWSGRGSYTHDAHHRVRCSISRL